MGIRDWRGVRSEKVSFSISMTVSVSILAFRENYHKDVEDDSRTPYDSIDTAY